MQTLFGKVQGGSRPSPTVLNIHSANVSTAQARQIAGDRKGSPLRDEPTVNRIVGGGALDAPFCDFISQNHRRAQGPPLHIRKGAPFGAPSSLAAAAAAVVLAAVPVAVAIAAAVAEDQQQDDDPPPVVAAEAPADPIVVRTHNRYLRSFCWALLPTLHVMTAASFCAAAASAG